MTFCDSDCTNDDCSRRLTNDILQDARDWWGEGESSPPMSIADFSSVCQGYTTNGDLK